VKELRDRVVREVRKVVVGQDHVVEVLLAGTAVGGHVLLEGVPGLAKTLVVKTLSQTINASFMRIQFTPDLLPADITGTTIYNMHTGQFTQKRGPLFANLVLADEVNRAPAKVQSALLEAMQERTRRTRCPIRSSCSRRRTRSSRRARSRCPRRSSIASCC
jgi:MoxR-like ATPase